MSNTEFRINTFTTGDQLSPSVAKLSDGGFVVTWASDGQDGDGNGIYGQRYDSYGSTAGSEFSVSTYTSGHQSEPSVTGLLDGGFVVSWASNIQDGDSWGIFAQRYDSLGSNVGPEFQINTYTSNSQSAPSITDLDDGGFVVTWESDGQDGDGKGIYGQRYDSSGSAASSEFRSTLTPVTTSLNHQLQD